MAVRCRATRRSSPVSSAGDTRRPGCLHRGHGLGIAAALAAVVLAGAGPAAAQTPGAPQPGQAFRECSDGCPEMVVVPAGSFTMGGEEVFEGPPRRVTIAKPFAVGKLEVSFGEWEACVKAKGCKSIRDRFHKTWELKGWLDAKHAVVNVSWLDAKDYAAWLSKKTGKAYRLLTEAEWEYAARAGTTTAYSWGAEIGQGNANCVGCGSQWDDKPAPVGSFKPNAFGLHDMHGNVWEWVEDCYHLMFEGAPSDGRAWMTDCTYPDDRVHRGGASMHDPRALRITARNNWRHKTYANGVGFRVARDL